MSVEEIKELRRYIPLFRAFRGMSLTAEQTMLLIPEAADKMEQLLTAYEAREAVVQAAEAVADAPMDTEQEKDAVVDLCEAVAEYRALSRRENTTP